MRVNRSKNLYSISIPKRLVHGALLLSITFGTGYGVRTFKDLDIKLPKFNKNQPITADQTLENEFLTPTPTITQKLGVSLKGEASWYGTGEGECLGCAPHYNEDGYPYYVMANGEILNDSIKTVACRMGAGNSCDQFPIGSKVRIRNLENNMMTEARVTDVGGLRPGRIIDMSKKVRDSLNAFGNIQVEVTLIKE